MFIRKITIKNPVTIHPERGCVVCLPGRGVPGFIMLRFARQMEMRRTVFATLDPLRLAWYPQPKGAHDQAATVNALPRATEAVREGIEKIKKATGFANSQIVLMGFSAGAVMALQVAMQEEAEPFAACVSLAGAIFEPWKVDKAKNQTPILLQHNRDDECFDWYERYLPMREALQDGGYNVIPLERDFGPHTLYVNDAVNVGEIIAPLLGYSKGFAKKYLHPKVKKKG